MDYYLRNPMRTHFFILSLFFILFSCNENKEDVQDDTTRLMTGPDTMHIRADPSGYDTIIRKELKPDCSVLKRLVPPSSMKEQTRRDLAELRLCRIDSFDFLYIVPNLFERWANEKEVQGEKVTYTDFVKHLEEFKTTDSYVQLRMRVSTLDSLRTVPFEQKKLHTLKPVLGRLGFTEEEWRMFAGFASTYPVPPGKSFTWGQMLDEFEKYSNTAPEQ